MTDENAWKGISSCLGNMKPEWVEDGIDACNTVNLL